MKYNIKFEEFWYDKDLLGISDDFVKALIKSSRSMIEIEHTLIKLKFVGILAYRSEMLILMPKYLSSSEYNDSDLLKHARLLIKVFKKLPQSMIIKYSKDFFTNKDINANAFAEISIADFLIRDYLHNGVFEKRYEITKKSSQGKVDWIKTVNKIDPFKSGKNILYFETYRKHITSNSEELITVIHHLVIDLCIAKYGQLFDIKQRVQNLSKIENRLNRIGHHVLLKTIENEMQQTFMEREIRVLKAMHSFFSNINSSKNRGFELYGTSKFHYVWEVLCSHAFMNQYDTFSYLINAPIWKTIDGKEYYSEKNKMEPDILKTIENNGENTFIILDAKYYSLILTEDRLSGQPGSYDIVKQFVYQIALESELTNYDQVFNVLVYPQIMNEIYQLIGTVQLEFFNKKPLINLYLSPEHLIELYLSNQVFDKIVLVSMIEDFKILSECRAGF